MAEVHKSGEGTSLAVAQDEDPWVSLDGAVALSGKAKSTVLLRALDGKVRHQKVAGRRVFHRDDVLAIRTRLDEDEESE